MAAELGLALALTAYHMDVLAERGATREVDPACEGGEPSYESAVAENPEILALLKAKETEDEGERAA